MPPSAEGTSCEILPPSRRFGFGSAAKQTLTIERKARPAHIADTPGLFRKIWKTIATPWFSTTLKILQLHPGGSSRLPSSKYQIRQACGEFPQALFLQFLPMTQAGEVTWSLKNTCEKAVPIPSAGCVQEVAPNSSCWTAFDQFYHSKNKSADCIAQRAY